MIVSTERSYTAQIYIAGPIEFAKQILRRECLEGLCVSIHQTDYIYTQGEEKGYVVGLINYPRFPKPPEEIYNRAVQLGTTLLKETYQGSFTIVATDKTEFFSLRKGDKV